MVRRKNMPICKVNVMYDVVHHVRRMFLSLIPDVSLG